MTVKFFASTLTRRSPPIAIQPLLQKIVGGEKLKEFERQQRLLVLCDLKPAPPNAAYRCCRRRAVHGRDYERANWIFC